MASSRNILLLGASGVLGSALAETLGVRLAGRTYLRHPVEGGIAFDARTGSINSLVERLPARPAAALVLLGETRIDACAADPRGTSEVNVAGVVRVVRGLAGLGILPVFVSSDAVFDGQRAHSTEDAEPRPILTYGRQKLEVERFMATMPPPWIVVRLPKLLSPMIDDWIRSLGERASIACATDQYFTPMRAADAAAAIIALVDQGAQGLYHVAGPERLSRRALLEAVIEEYRKYAQPAASITECSMREIERSQGLREPRPLDTSMRSTRLSAFNLPGVEPASSAARTIVRVHFARQPRR